MNPAIPRMHMFAGPNGSGKSTIDGFNSELFGVYVNPADIKKEILRHGMPGLMLAFMQNSGRLRAARGEKGNKPHQGDVPNKLR